MRFAFRLVACYKPRVRDRNTRESGAPADLDEMRRLLKQLWRYRNAQAAGGGFARLHHRWRRNALLARLDAAWPGGAVLHETGDLVVVPRPLDARGRAALLIPPRLHAAVLAFVPRDGVALDIGANLGEWTVPLARAVGADGRVVAFEPMRVAADALAETVRLNHLRQIEVVTAAVSDRAGRAVLAVPQVTSSAIDTGRSRLGPAAAGEQAFEVETVTLDALPVAALTRLDLIKIDVEGHERAVLGGGAETIRRWRPAIVIETGHEQPDDRAAIAAQLAGAGYEIAGILLDYGMALADWDAYRVGAAPFVPGAAHNMLLLPSGATRRER
jgi:FkbM family methyltransferase